MGRGEHRHRQRSPSVSLVEIRYKIRRTAKRGLAALSVSPEFKEKRSSMKPQHVRRADAAHIALEAPCSRPWMHDVRRSTLRPTLGRALCAAAHLARPDRLN